MILGFVDLAGPVGQGGDKGPQVIGRAAEEAGVDPLDVGLVGLGHGPFQVEDVDLLNRPAHFQGVGQGLAARGDQVVIEGLQVRVGELAHGVANGGVRDVVAVQQGQHRVHVALLRAADVLEDLHAPHVIQGDVDIPGQFFLFPHVFEIGDLYGIQGDHRRLGDGGRITAGGLGGSFDGRGHDDQGKGHNSSEESWDKDANGFHGVSPYVNVW